MLVSRDFVRQISISLLNLRMRNLLCGQVDPETAEKIDLIRFRGISELRKIITSAAA